MGSKHCTKCQQTLDISCFTPRADRPQGQYSSWCKQCRRAVYRHSNPPKTKPTLLDRVENYIERIPIAGCWIWTAAVSKGYGVIGVSRSTKKAHRVVYELLVGQISKGKMLCHRCDVPECVNPHHMFIGSAGDNNRDRDNKGRRVQVRGEQVKNAVLTANAVSAMRKMHRETGSKSAVTKAFPFNKRTIEHAIYRYNWKHID